jgi:PAS domain S-box-containing protein
MVDDTSRAYMTAVEDPFVGEGEVQRLGREMNWSATPLGPPQSWSGTLRDMVRACVESPFPICLWCGPERILIYNDAYRDILGAKHPAALGRPGSEVWAEIWDEIGPWFQDIVSGGAAVYKQDAPFHVRRSEPTPSLHAAAGSDGRAAAGSTREGAAAPNAWFTFSLSPVRDDTGEIVAFLNIVSETTRRRQAEEAREEARSLAQAAEARLQDVFAQAPAFMAVLRGPDHVFEYANEAYLQLVGKRELVGRPVHEALPEAREQGFEGLLDRVTYTGEPYVGREVPITLRPDPDGPSEERFLDFVYYPITGPDGTVTGVVAHGSDVTEHVLARREAQRARTEAEQANLAKSQFLATMSHEIRTPINAAMGYADLLDAGIAGKLTESQQKYVDGIRTSSRHLLGLVSDVLDLAKIDAGETMVGVTDTELRPPVEAAVRLVAPQAGEKGLALDAAWQCDPAIRVRADEERVRQILINLLSNAAKFTDTGGSVTVRCRTSRAPSGGSALPEIGPWVVVDVEDTGRGMTEEQQARVFDPFIQVEAGLTRQTGGTGLGLTISRRLARLMGGELAVRSTPGQGSCFSLWLPSLAQERVSEPAGEISTPAERAWPPPPEELPGLAPAGRALLGVVERVNDAWVERLRDDPAIDAAKRATRAQTADQTAELVTAFAKILYILEEGGGDPILLEDAEAVQTFIARRHGRQRRRLGWGRGELEREYKILGEILDDELRREAPKRTAADLGNALAVVRRLVQKAAATSLAVYDDGPQPSG